MRIPIYFLVVSLLSFSCSRPDKICDCIKASEELNIESRRFLNKTPTKKEIIAFKQLQKKKKRKCNAFETMKGSEMLEKKSTCKQT